jgi:hypothetical protein
LDKNFGLIIDVVVMVAGEVRTYDVVGVYHKLFGCAALVALVVGS